MFINYFNKGINNLIDLYNLGYIQFNNQFNAKKPARVTLSTSNDAFMAEDDKDYDIDLIKAEGWHYKVETGHGNISINFNEIDSTTYEIITGNGNDTVFINRIYNEEFEGLSFMHLGDGNDTATLSAAYNLRCYMGDGNDRVIMKKSSMGYISLGAGNDHIEILDGLGAVSGGQGDDIFVVTTHAMGELKGDAGNDTFIFKGAMDYTTSVYGGSGNDTFKFDHTYSGHGGDISIEGGSGADRFYFVSSMGIYDLSFSADGDQVIFDKTSEFYKDHLKVFKSEYADIIGSEGQIYENDKFKVYARKGLKLSDIFNQDGSLKPVSNTKLASHSLSKQNNGQLSG